MPYQPCDGLYKIVIKRFHGQFNGIEVKSTIKASEEIVRRVNIRIIPMASGTIILSARIRQTGQMMFDQLADRDIVAQIMKFIW